MKKAPYHRELATAIEAAHAAASIQLSFLSRDKRVSIKQDASPVTRVDTACEARIRRILSAAFPADGFLGEESGGQDGTGRRRWIVDPIDGTRPYIRGIPTYSSLIALEDHGQVVVGVICLPGLGETYWARSGGGAFCNGRRIRVSTVRRPAAAMGSGIGFLERRGTRAARGLLSLMGSWGYAYGYMDAYSYASVASGRIDVCVSLLDKPWDCAAPSIIIREAGGKLTDIRGRPTIYGGAVVASNGLLHQQTVAHFTGARPGKGHA